MENNAMKMFANIRPKEKNQILSYENLYQKCRNAMLNRLDKTRKNKDYEEAKNLEIISSWALGWMKDIQGQTEYLIKKGGICIFNGQSEGIIRQYVFRRINRRVCEQASGRCEEAIRRVCEVKC